MTSLSRRSLITGIGKVILAGSVPAFLPKLLPEIKPVYLPDLELVKARDYPLAMTVHDIHYTGYANVSAKGIWTMHYEIEGMVSESRSVEIAMSFT